MTLRQALTELANNAMSLSTAAGRTSSDVEVARRAEELIEEYRISVDDLGLFQVAEA